MHQSIAIMAEILLALQLHFSSRLFGSKLPIAADYNKKFCTILLSDPFYLTQGGIHPGWIPFILLFDWHSFQEKF